MSNPALNDDVYRQARNDELQAGWASPGGAAAPPAAAPQAPSPWAPGFTAPGAPQGYGATPPPPPGYPGVPGPGHPQDQGSPQGSGFRRGSGGARPNAPWRAGPSPVSAWDGTDPAGYKPMRLGGVVSATGVLLSLLVVSAFFGWQAVKVAVDGSISSNAFPLMLVGILVGLGLAIGMRRAPKLAVVLGPLYALAEGFALGAISHIYASDYNGLVVEAVFVTIAVFAVMLFLFAFRIIKVTDRMRSIVFAAMGGIFVIYMVDIVLSLFGSHLPVIDSASPLGIAFSIIVCIVAAFRLLISFDFVDRGIQMKAPRYMEWYSAFALLASVVWIYIEVLQLLAKLRGGRR